MKHIIIVPPPIILELKRADFCNECLMSDETERRDQIFCEVLRKRLERNAFGYFPRPRECVKLTLREAQEGETDRDVQQIQLKIEEVKF